MTRYLTLFVLALGLADVRADDPASDAAKAPAVTVPTFANASCPIMAKKASLKLFVDTPSGRIYMCCIKCAKEIRADPERARAAAYPKVERTKNTVCPVTGETIPEKDAPTITLQGYEVPLCCKGCADDARANAQVTLVKATNPNVRDVANRTCPITGKPVVANAFALVGDDLIRLSSPECVEGVTKDAAAALRKAKESVKEKGEGHGEGDAGHEKHKKDSGHGGGGADDGRDGHDDDEHDGHGR